VTTQTLRRAYEEEVQQNLNTGCPLSGDSQGHHHMTKFVILHPLIISAACKDRAFKFYTEFSTDEYNKIYTQDGP